MIDDGDIGTIVITKANTRSVKDIQKMLKVGYESLRADRTLLRAQEGSEPVLDYEEDVGSPMGTEEAQLLPPTMKYSVAISNVGKFGLTSGSGALSPFSATTELVMGERRKLPHWRMFAYFPAWYMSIGCLQDHRVVDGVDAGCAMRQIYNCTSQDSISQILKAEDTISREIQMNPPMVDSCTDSMAKLSIRARKQLAVSSHIVVSEETMVPMQLPGY